LTQKAIQYYNKSMKLTYRKKLLIAFLLCFLFLFTNYLVVNVALADCPPEGGGPCKLDNPLQWGSGDTLLKNDDPRIIIGNIIRAALALIGAVALAMFILGGYMWLFSAGNQERVKKGRNTLVWASIGLAVIFASYGIVSWVLANLKGIAT